MDPDFRNIEGQTEQHNTDNSEAYDTEYVKSQAETRQRIADKGTEELWFNVLALIADGWAPLQAVETTLKYQEAVLYARLAATKQVPNAALRARTAQRQFERWSADYIHAMERLTRNLQRVKDRNKDA